MNERPGFSSQGRSVVQGFVFLTFCLALLLALLWTPKVGAGQNFDQNRTFAFHGHRVTVASASDLANGSSKGLSGVTGLVHIPGGLVIPPLIHVFAPGPTQQGDQGLDVEPNVISNFRGFAAQAYPVGLGTATDNEGHTYDVNSDMRVFQGEYVSSDGTHHRGTFVLVWIDLYEPGSGFSVQLHDFNGGIQPSGLFWIVQVPDDALKIEGLTATLHVENVSVIDNFQFLSPNAAPATVSFDMTWTAIGPVMHFQPLSTDPTDPSNFAAEFRLAKMTGTFSGSEAGFSFTATGAAEGIATGNPDGSFAEMGTERNGFFLLSNH